MQKTTNLVLLGAVKHDLPMRVASHQILIIGRVRHVRHRPQMVQLLQGTQIVVLQLENVNLIVGVAADGDVAPGRTAHAGRFVAHLEGAQFLVVLGDGDLVHAGRHDDVLLLEDVHAPRLGAQFEVLGLVGVSCCRPISVYSILTKSPAYLRYRPASGYRRSRRCTTSRR